MEKFTSIGSTAVHYRDNCRGEKALILLHGYLESLEIWDEFATELSKAGYRVTSLDLPGHGISEVLSETHTMDFLAGIVNLLMEKMALPKATLVGHSMGGYVALAFAQKYPEKLEGLVLFHATPYADTEEKKNDRRREIGVIRAGRKELLSRTFPDKRFAPENRKRLKEIIESLMLQVMLTEDEGIIAILNGMMQREDMNAMLHQLRVPQLFIFGREDQHLPAEVTGPLIQAHPQARIAWLEHSAHMGFLEEPAVSLQILEEFLPLSPKKEDQPQHGSSC